jgi:hypothetical protein
MKTVRVFAIFLAAAVHLAGAEEFAPWGSNKQPGDAAKRHVEDISSAHSGYSVMQAGSMDGQNCRSPQDTWRSYEQTWESNRSVRIENIGDSDVVAPWLSNGRNNFRTLDEIVNAAVKPGMSDKEKSFALWWQEIQFRYHFPGDNDELCDPVKIFNVYGHNTCGNDSICLAGLWRKAGLKSAPCRAVGHCISQVFYDGRWHLHDGDMHAIYLLRDNETVAGEQDVMRDHDLIKRTHTRGIMQPEDRSGDEHEASLYVFEGAVNGERNCPEGTSMDFTLRPGEALTWRWGHLNPVKYHGSAPSCPDAIANGLWEYQPDLAKETWRTGAASVSAIRSDGNGLAAEAGKNGSIVWLIASPYVLVGGKVEMEGHGAKLELSWDGKSWQGITGNLDQSFPAGGPARYRYQLRCQLSDDARLTRLRIVNDLQMAPLTLPGMVVGDNAFVYTDKSPAQRTIRITHEWVERSGSKPPDAPPGPVFPADGAAVDGTDLAFQWKPPKAADGERITDYFFELSAYPDMRWPVSMNFARLTSRTDGGKAQYTLPAAGLLASDRRYFWRVRAKNSSGVWGSWSATWSFTPHAAEPPLEVMIECVPDRGTGILTWKANPAGRKPVTFRIYGSDEKGFTASDTDYKVSVGQSKDLKPQFPANFIAETVANELPVLGVDGLPAANKTYYRVVAVDGQGKRSGPSDFASAPRPVIYSRPVAAAKVGEAYSYRCAANRSLGDLRNRQINGKEVTSFYDVESPTYALQQGPPWLRINAQTGELSGTPDAAGKAEVAIVAVIERENRKLDDATLRWGNEKVVSNAVERVGAATQRFVIDVSR